MLFSCKKKKKKDNTPPLYHNYSIKIKYCQDLTFSLKYVIIVVGGEMDKKNEHLFASRRNAPGRIIIGAGAGNAAGRAAKAKTKKKKKKRSSPYIIPQHARTCQEFFEKFFCKIFVKFGLSSLDFKKFLWYNIYGGREATNEQTFVSPPQPPNLLLYHKGAAFVKSFRENFFRKFFKKVLLSFFVCDIIIL